MLQGRQKANASRKQQPPPPTASPPARQTTWPPFLDYLVPATQETGHPCVPQVLREALPAAVGNGELRSRGPCQPARA